LSTEARAHVRRIQLAVLAFYCIDGLLLTAYGIVGTVPLSIGWIYGLVGCAGAGAIALLFWLRGGRVAELGAMTLAQSVVAGLVMLATMAAAPPVGGMMLMSMMAMVALSAVQLEGRPLLLLCLALPAATVTTLAFVGVGAAIPTGSLAERCLTGVWLAWLMAKSSAHNVAGTKLRESVSKANAGLADALQKLERVAATDELTGLPNRRAISTRFRLALEAEGGSGVGVVLLDIDQFKSINDRYGHETGDQVLQVFGQLVSRSLRPSDDVGRYGGEEFLLVLRQVRDAAAATEAGERVRAVVAGHDWGSLAAGLSVTTSAGVALVAPGEDRSAAIRRADAALYEAKRRGRNLVVLG
jgi:diguanylate cyclase (GGDEF)-like protein